MEAKLRKTRWGAYEVRLTKQWVPSEIGDLAIRFATHFGIVAAKTDGQDQAGRAKLELQTVEEIVERSCSLAKALVERMEKEGWIVKCPDLPDDAEELGDIMPEKDLKKVEPPEDTTTQGGS
jgi:hypothetical protein